MNLLGITYNYNTPTPVRGVMHMKYPGKIRVTIDDVIDIVCLLYLTDKHYCKHCHKDYSVIAILLVCHIILLLLSPMTLPLNVFLVLRLSACIRIVVCIQ